MIAIGEVQLSWVPTNEMLADGLTKALPVSTFEEHRHLLGLRDLGEQAKKCVNAMST